MLKPYKPLVVLVEDDPAVLGALTFAFETDGYDVEPFSGPQGVLDRAPLGAGVCMIIDEKLPKLSGLDLLAQLRARGVTAPAFLITTNPSQHMRRRAAVAGVEIVEKPLLGDVLRDKVRDALNREAPSGEG
jgi:two-component system, LuxR family, response regulator FixJ